MFSLPTFIFTYSHKGRIIETSSKSKGRSRSRSPRPRWISFIYFLSDLMSTILLLVGVLTNREQFKGIGMNTRTRITGGEVAAEVEVKVIVTGIVERNERVVVGAEAAVQVLIITRIVGEADMMMNGVVAVGHLEGIIYIFISYFVPLRFSFLRKLLTKSLYLFDEVPLLLGVVPVLEEALLHAEHHPRGKKVQLDASETSVHLLRRVSHPVVDLLLILEVHLHIILMLM